MKREMTIITAIIICCAAIFSSCKKEQKEESVQVEEIIFTNIIDDILTIEIGEEFNVTYELLPENADQNILLEWYSEDESIASVEDGTIEGISEGETYITASYKKVEAYFKVNVISSDNPENPENPETDVLFSENFDSGLSEGWEVVDADGDGFNWELGSVIFRQPVGVDDTDAIVSLSYSNDTGAALTPDNYLISPEITIPSGEYTLSWTVFATDRSWYAEHYTVYIREGENDTEVFSETLSTADYSLKSVELEQFAGKTIRIVFRHHDVTDQFAFGLDNIIVANKI